MLLVCCKIAKCSLRIYFCHVSHVGASWLGESPAERRGKGVESTLGRWLCDSYCISSFYCLLAVGLCVIIASLRAGWGKLLGQGKLLEVCLCPPVWRGAGSALWGCALLVPAGGAEAEDGAALTFMTMSFNSPLYLPPVMDALIKRGCGDVVVVLRPPLCWAPGCARVGMGLSHVIPPLSQVGTACKGPCAAAVALPVSHS